MAEALGNEKQGKARETVVFPKPEGLTPKQEKAILALLQYPTMKDAAASIGVNEATIWKWQQTDVFHRAYITARRHTTMHGIARLQSYATMAADTLKDIMEDTKAPASARVAAAKAILDYGQKGVEIEDHEARLRELEAIMEPKK